MEHKGSDYVVSFDTLYTTNHIQILKVLLHHLPEEEHASLAVMIKMMELQYTLSHSKKVTGQINICSKPKKEIDLPNLLQDISIYCDETEKKKIKQLTDMFQTMQMFEEMQKFAEFMPSFTGSNGGEDAGSSTDGGFDIFSMMQNMLSPEQLAMFEMFQTKPEP